MRPSFVPFVAVSFCALLPAAALAAPGRVKVDRALRASVQAGDRTQQVIVTVNPGCRAAVRDALVNHGDSVRTEFESVDAVAGEIHSRDVDVLATNGCVK